MKNKEHIVFAASAKCIVTEDHHFNVLKKIDFPHIEVIGIDLFCQVLSQNHNNLDKI